MVLASSGSGGLAEEGGAGKGLSGEGTRPGEATGGGINDRGLVEGAGVGSGDREDNITGEGSSLGASAGRDPEDQSDLGT